MHLSELHGGRAPAGYINSLSILRRTATTAGVPSAVVNGGTGLCGLGQHRHSLAGEEHSRTACDPITDTL